MAVVITIHSPEAAESSELWLVVDFNVLPVVITLLISLLTPFADTIFYHCQYYFIIFVSFDSMFDLSVSSNKFFKLIIIHSTVVNLTTHSSVFGKNLSRFSLVATTLTAYLYTENF